MVNTKDLDKYFLESNFKRSIEINERELIMKILARYSGKYTVLRELIQNSDDSNSTFFKINLYPEKHEIHIINDGFIFRDIDWTRICTIASGNPEENKIGCFGVGFYSVFSISEFPTIISGSKMLQFRFKNMSLKTQLINSENYNENTIFIFENVNNDIFEDWLNSLNIKKFLNDSLLFTKMINKIYFNNEVYIKKSIYSESLNNYNGFSSKNIISKINKCNLNIYSILNKKNIQLSAEIDIEYNSEYMSKIVKHMTKKLPKKTLIQISLNDSDAFTEGYVFIGYKTQQTTGFGFDVNAQFIATVERENMDLNDYLIREWNIFLLSNIGILFKEFYNYYCKTNHLQIYYKIIRGLSFIKSTPLNEIGDIILNNFINKCNNNLNIYVKKQNEYIDSKKCIFINDEYKLNTKDDKNYLICKYISSPYVTIQKVNDRLTFFEILMNNNLITKFDDKILNYELQIYNSINLEIINDLLEWLIEMNKKNINSIKLFNNIILTFLKLHNIKYYLNENQKEFFIKSDIVIDYNIFIKFNKNDLEKYFNWKKIPIVLFTNLFFKQNNNIENIENIKNFLKYLSLNSLELDNHTKISLISFLKNIKCIPIINKTQQLLCKPNETYFENDKHNIINLNYICADLTNLNKNLFLELGVKTKLSIIDFINNYDQNSTNNEILDNLIELVEIDDQNINILENSKLFWNSNKTNKFITKNMYFYNKNLESLGFNTFSDITGTSTQIEILEKIGLKKKPKLDELLQCTNKSIVIDFLINNMEYYKSDYENNKIPFISTNQSLKNYNECYVEINPLNFPYINNDLQCYSKILQIDYKIPIELVINWLQKNKIEETQMENIFEYFLSRIDELKNHIDIIQKISFIPFNNNYYKYNEIFFNNKEYIYSNIIDYIEIKENSSFLFLSQLGVTDTPTPLQLYQNIVKNYKRYFDLNNIHNGCDIQNCNIFISWLIEISTNLDDDFDFKDIKDLQIFPSLKYDSKDKLKKYTYISNITDCVLIDDSRLLSTLLPTHCPINLSLEKFYIKCGATWLNNFIIEQININTIIESPLAKEISKYIINRIPLFLYDKQGNYIDHFTNDAKNIIENINIKITNCITKTYEYQSKIFEENVSCAIKDNILFISQNEELDYFDISYIICKYLICKNLYQIESVYTRMGMILTRSLQSLERQGWDINLLKNKLLNNNQFDNFSKFVNKQKENCKLQKVDQVEKVNKVEKVEKAEKLEKVEEIQKVDEIEKVDEVEEVDKVDEVDEIEKVEKYTNKLITKYKNEKDNSYHNLFNPNITKSKSNKSSLSTVVKNKLNLFNDNKIDSFEKVEKNFDDTDSCVNLDLNIYKYKNIEIFSDIELDDEILLKLDNYKNAKDTLLFYMNIDVKYFKLFYKKSDIEAFNKNGSIFLNIFHFELDENFYWKWFVIICHELAHNLEISHNKYFINIFQDIISENIDSFIKNKNKKY